MIFFAQLGPLYEAGWSKSCNDNNDQKDHFDSNWYINNTVSNVILINTQTQPQQSLTKPGSLMPIMMITTMKRKLHHQQCWLGVGDVHFSFALNLNLNHCLCSPCSHCSHRSLCSNCNCNCQGSYCSDCSDCSHCSHCNHCKRWNQKSLTDSMTNWAVGLHYHPSC